jgi:polysaccharide export outer membrane protein
MKHIIFSFILVAGLVGGVKAASGQELAKDAGPSTAPVRAPQGLSSEYQLGPGDLVSIRVSGLREFEHSTRLSNSGRIRVPYVGVMMAAGMTALEVEREVARLIKDHELINEPSVRVYVEQHRAQPTYAIGEVDTPGQFVITGEMYLLDLISRAGGLMATADSTGFLYRRNSQNPRVQTRILGADATAADSATPGSPAQAPSEAEAKSKAEEVIQIDFNALREGTKPEMNVRLQGGDILYVPRRTPENFFVIGDVKVPGAYTLPRRSKISAAQAIIYAGGPLPTAKSGKGFLMRHDEAGIRQARPVDFAGILKGEEPDFTIEPNDIIFIPKGALQTIGIGLLNLMPLLVQQFAIF